MNAEKFTRGNRFRVSRGGAIGGAIGLSMGGPAGAAVGAAIGAQVGMVRQQIAGLAEYSASLALQRKALRLVINDTNQYNQSQKFLLQTSRELAIPQEVITRQFTSLTASVVGAGQSVADSEKVFQAIAAGIRGTGGNLEDMKAAMRATSQVFSKGKVSAEELRQQLGERLPGAFTLFATSMNKTPAELDKALEQGKVTLEDFLGFSQKLFDEYGENAKILAQAPESAGDRLKTEISNLKDNLGDLLRPIGAEFQAVFSDIVEIINGAITAFKEFMGIGLENAIKKMRVSIEDLNKEGRTRLLKAFDSVNSHFKDVFVKLFNGGKAHLELVDADDPLEAGLEMMVSPPGKKLQSMSLLSGGEQALTALSLIFAVFLTNPSPICVLDEVDAPLDDANVDRFCGLLDSITEKTNTKFLIITHHALTMSRMDRLFGVTMAERGVSQIVSVDLKKAEEIGAVA